MSQIDARQLEEGDELHLDFQKLNRIAATGAALMPVAVQDIDSGQVIIIGYANRQALDYTLEHRVATFWSTSRNELWIKGATSGDTLQIVEVRVNCEQNSLLYLVRLLGGGACHTYTPEGRTRRSCYYRRIRDGHLEFIDPQERQAQE